MIHLYSIEINKPRDPKDSLPRITEYTVQRNTYKGVFSYYFSNDVSQHSKTF